MKIRKDDIIELWIDRIAFGGDGIGRFNGLVIFVRGGIPGDRVIAQIIKKKKDYANAVILEIIDPSMDRIIPLCPYSGYCGGCQLQHLKYKRQLEYKREHILDAMTRIGTLPDIRVHPVIPCENIFGYRNKMEFSFSDRRWLLPEELARTDVPKDFALGLHVPGTFNKVIDTHACLLIPDTGNKILGDVRRYVRKSGIPPYGLKSHEGFWRFLMLRHGAMNDEWMVNIITSEEQRGWVQPLADQLYHAYENITSVVNNINTRI